MKHATVLVIIDPDAEAHPGIARGAELAQRMDASLELYVCDAVQAVPERWAGALNMRQYGELLREQRLELLEQLAHPLRAQGLQVITNSDSRPSLEQGVLRHVVETKPITVIDEELSRMLGRMYGPRSGSLGHQHLSSLDDAQKGPAAPSD